MLFCASMAAITYFGHQNNKPIQLTQEDITQIVQVEEAKKTYAKQMKAINAGSIQTSEHEKAFIQLCNGLSDQYEMLADLGITKQELTGVAGACTYVHNAMLDLIDFRTDLEKNTFRTFDEYSTSAWIMMNNKKVNGLIVRLKLLRKEGLEFPYYKEQLNILQKEMFRVAHELVDEKNTQYSYLQQRTQARSAYSRLTEYINAF